MRLLLVNPPRVDPFSRRPSAVHEPPLNLAYLASYLLAQGKEADILDCQAEALSFDGSVQRILDSKADYVGLTAHTAIIHTAALLSEALKEKNSSLKTIVGGYHISCLPKPTMIEFPTFDLGIYGEGELSLHALVEAVENNRPLGSVNGLIHRKDADIIINPTRNMIPDLDVLPFPRWDILPLDRYVPHYSAGKRHREVPISTGRGCSGKCAMCARVSGETVRFRSLDSILGEIQEDVFRHRARSLIFMDETFTADLDRVEAICDRLIREGYPDKIFWLCETRSNRVHKQLFLKMARAGCKYVAFGLESGNQEILNHLRKGITLGQSRVAVQWAKEAGLIVDTFYILGLPYETDRTIRDTLRFSLSLPCDYANFFILVPYPGTQVMEMAKSGEGGLKLLTTDWRKYGFQMGKALELEKISRQRLELYQLCGYLLFYLRPSRIRNMFRIVNFSSLPIYFLNMFRSILPKRKNAS